MVDEFGACSILDIGCGTGTFACMLARKGLDVVAVDPAIMTGNVAQVFLTDDEWLATLGGIRNALRPGGRVVFEVRDPSRTAWRAWNREETYERAEVPGVGIVNHWGEVTAVTGQLVTFKWTFHFERSGDVMTSDSTLRFRERDEVESSLRTAGLDLLEVRDAPDRPRLEFVFVAQRPA